MVQEKKDISAFDILKETRLPGFFHFSLQQQ